MFGHYAQSYRRICRAQDHADRDDLRHELVDEYNEVMDIVLKARKRHRNGETV